MSKYLISDLIFQFFHLYRKKSSKSSQKKKKKKKKKGSPDISLQHKNKAGYKFSKKKTFALGQKSAGAERVNSMNTIIYDCLPVLDQTKIVSIQS